MPFLLHFCVSRVITTAHAHESGVLFHIFPRAFKQKKIKALRPIMTQIASRDPAQKKTKLRLPLRDSFSFLLKFQTPNTLCSAELWLGRLSLAHFADLRSLLRHVSCERCRGAYKNHVDLGCHPYTYFTCGVSFA